MVEVGRSRSRRRSTRRFFALALSLALVAAGGLFVRAAINAATQDALVTSHTGQTITADSIALNAQAGHRAVLQNLGSGDQTVRLWNVTNPAHPTPLGQPLTGQTDRGCALAFIIRGTLGP